jgi:GMP synthase-like glutamine amidotransferase
MTTDMLEQTPLDQPEPIPFPYSQRTFCPYEPIERSIDSVRVLVVNCLLRDERDISDFAREDWAGAAESRLGRERDISCLALDNIVNNVTRLVREPVTRVSHLSEIAEAAREFEPQAIVLSGTLTDFDYYDPGMLARFGEFLRGTKTPVLGICGGHQLVGVCYGARCVTLDNFEPRERQQGRMFEYQYRFVRISDTEDPIFRGINDRDSGLWQDYTTEGRILRVWQNHGLMLDRVPEGFRLLATAYLCRNQMMVRRGGGQLIYTVQFHLEKSFQDLTSNLSRIDPNLPPEERKRLLRKEAGMRTLWAHPNESRDGRILFENFLRLALEHDPEAKTEDDTIADLGLRIADSAGAARQPVNASNSQHETGM